MDLYIESINEHIDELTMDMTQFRDYLLQYLHLNKLYPDREDRKCNESMLIMDTKTLHKVYTVSEKYKFQTQETRIIYGI